MGKVKNNFNESLMLNQASFYYYLDRLTDLALSRFKWNNLPETVDARFLELIEFTDGKALYFNDDVMGDLTLKFAIGGRLSVYREPLDRYVIADNGYSKNCTEKDSVIIWNNMLHQNTYPQMLYYAKLIWDLDMTVRVNAKAQKTPIILVCDETERLSVLNMYKEYDGNSPVIRGRKGINNSMEVLQTGAPYVADKIYALKTQYWNEALTFLGISNVTYQKKERMLSDEVERTQGGVIASRKSALSERERACEKINRMFNTDISVEYDEELNEMDTSLPELPKVGDIDE